MALSTFEYSKSWRSAQDFPSYEENEERVRDDMQCLFDEVRDALNRLVGELKAENLPFAPTAEIDASTLQNALELLQAQISGAAIGQLPNASVTTEKLAELAVTGAKLAEGAVTGGKLAAGAVTEEKIAAAAALDAYYSQALPEDKVGLVKKEMAAGKVIMLGDGINDAPALSAADVGIAIEGSSSIASDTADIVLSEGGLESVARTRLLGQRLISKINSNNLVIVGLNSALLLLGSFGLISPQLAAVLHNSATVAISVQAMRPLLDKERE